MKGEEFGEEIREEDGRVVGMGIGIVEELLEKEGVVVWEVLGVCVILERGVEKIYENVWGMGVIGWVEERRE